MEIALLIIGVVLGAGCSWLVTHWYYRKSNADQGLVYDKLTDEVRQLIRDDQRTRISVRELNELLDQRTIDPNSSAPLPFLACPRCGSENLSHKSATDAQHDEIYYMIDCRDCHWSDWTQ